MKIITYFLCLFLGGFVYFLFAAYMTVSAGYTYGPIISAFLSILIFGFLSWFHFYRPKLGVILLIIAFLGMYFTWPIYLLISYFGEADYKPGLIEFLTPIVLGILAIFLGWKGKSEDLNTWTKLALAIPPALIGLYVGGYMAFRMIF